MPFSDYLENKVQDSVKRGQTFPSFATYYVGVLKCSKGARANSTAYSLNDTVAVMANDSKYHLYKVTTAGTTAAAQSTLYPGVAGEAITDGTAVLTEQTNVLCAGGSTVWAMEPSTGAYARVAVTGSLTAFTGTHGTTTGASSGSGGTVTNATTITFPTPSANWTTTPEQIWGWAIFDSATLGAGNLLEWGSMNVLQQVLNGQSAASFASGVMTSTISA